MRSRQQRRERPRAMPLRRRRDGAAIQARTRGAIPRSRKSSGAAEGTSILPTVPALRGAASKVDLGRPGKACGPFQDARRVESTTRVSGALRGGHAVASSLKRGAGVSPSLGRFDPPFVSSAQAERDTTKVVASEGWFAGLRCGNASARPTQPASVGAGDARGASLPRARAKISSSMGVPARRSKVAEVGKRRRSSKTSAPLPVATGRANGGSVRARLRKEARADEKASITGARGGKAAARRGRPEPGARKGAAGQRSLRDGRHLGSSMSRIGHAIAAARVSAALAAWMLGSRRESASRHAKQERRQGCQRQRPHGSRREENARRDRQHGKTCGPPKFAASAMKQATILVASAQAFDARGIPTRRGFSYEEVRRQKSVRRIARREHSMRRKANRWSRRWPNDAPHGVLTHLAAVAR